MKVLCFIATSSYSAQNGVLWIRRSRIPWLGSLDGKGIPGGAFSGLFGPFGNESHGLKNFNSSVFYIHYVRLLQWAAPTILLAFLLHTGGRLLFWHVVTMWRKKNGPSTSIKKKVLPLHVDMSRNKKRTKPYYRSFFTFTKDRCPVDLSHTHSHTFIAISKNSQTVEGLPQPRLLF